MLWKSDLSLKYNVFPFIFADPSDRVMSFSDAEDTMNDSELPDYKEDGIDVEMQLADRYIFFKMYYNTTIK